MSLDTVYKTEMQHNSETKNKKSNHRLGRWSSTIDGVHCNFQLVYKNLKDVGPSKKPEIKYDIVLVCEDPYVKFKGWCKKNTILYQQEIEKIIQSFWTQCKLKRPHKVEQIITSNSTVSINIEINIHH